MEYLKRCGENTKNDYIKIMEQIRLNEEGFTFSEDKKYYELDGEESVKYSYKNGPKHSLKKYKDCGYFDSYILNAKEKVYRLIKLEDFNDIDEEGFFWFDDKLCARIKTPELKNDLHFINENSILSNVGIEAMNTIKKFEFKDILDTFYDYDSKEGRTKKRVHGYAMFGEDYIDEHIRNIYEMLMTKQCSFYSEEFKKYSDEFNNNIKGLSDIKHNMNNIYILVLFLNNHPIKNNFCDSFISIDEILKELKHKHIWKNIKNNLWLEYEYNNIMRKDDNFVQGEDFTFLILNLIKAIEYFLYYKLSKTIKNDDKNIDDKTMFNELICHIDMSVIRDELKDRFDEKHLELFKKELLYVKDECRNGYFHKDRIDTYEQLIEKRKKAFEVLIEIAILLK